MTRLAACALACFVVGCAADQSQETSPPAVFVGDARIETHNAVGEDATRYAQAAELRRMGQPQAALAVLAGLEASAVPGVAGRSLALAGVIHAERDELEAAEAALRRALEGDDTWPGYGKALADLGIVLLRRGDEIHGLRTLERAEVRLEQEGDARGLTILRGNRERYLEIAGRRTK